MPHPEPLSFFQGSALPQVPFLHPREPKSTQSLSVFQGSHRVIQSPSAFQSPFFCPRERYFELSCTVCLPLSLSPSSSKGAYPQFDFVCLSSVCPQFEVDGKGVRHYSVVSSLLIRSLLVQVWSLLIHDQEICDLVTSV